MEVDTEIDRLYGLPLDEFVRERDDLAKRLNREGDREAGARVKTLRKPTVGAWALNQAVRRRRAETDALLATGTRLRAAHADLLTGGDPAVLREAMDEERSLTTSLADCAEAIASETGKSGPALRERVRSTLHAATVDEEAREELARGRFVREREAVGLGPFGGDPATAAPARTKRAAKSPAPKTRAPKGKEAEREAAAERGAAEREHAARIEEAERLLGEAQAGLEEAQSAHSETVDGLESAREAVRAAEEEERAARKAAREQEREVAKRERDLERLRAKRG